MHSVRWPGFGINEPSINERRIKKIRMVLACLSLLAVQSACAGPWRTLLSNTRGTLALGLTEGQLDWSIASDYYGLLTPDVLSELTYDMDASPTLRVGARTLWHADSDSPLQLDMSAQWTRVWGGREQDSDYDGNGRTQEWSRSYAELAGDNLWQTSIGLTQLVQPDGARWLLGVGVGFAYAAQQMRVQNGVQIISQDLDPNDGIPPVALGPFAGLDTTYQAEWISTWLGAEWLSSTGSPSPSGQWRLQYRFYTGDYFAQANWNLRSDFAHPVSFEHSANSSGRSLVVEYSRPLPSLPRSLQGVLRYERLLLRTDAGTDTIHSADGSRGKTRLNGAHWQEQGLQCGLVMRF